MFVSGWVSLSARSVWEGLSGSHDGVCGRDCEGASRSACRPMCVGVVYELFIAYMRAVCREGLCRAGMQTPSMQLDEWSPTSIGRRIECLGFRVAFEARVRGVWGRVEVRVLV